MINMYLRINGNVVNLPNLGGFGPKITGEETPITLERINKFAMDYDTIVIHSYERIIAIKHVLDAAEKINLCAAKAISDELYTAIEEYEDKNKNMGKIEFIQKLLTSNPDVEIFIKNEEV